MKVTLKQRDLALAPGGTTSVDVKVENTGRSSVSPTLDVVGLDGAVPSGITHMAEIAPGESGWTTLTLTLPADAAPGDRRLAVIAKDPSRRDHVAAHMTLRTESAADVSLHVSPREQRARVRSRFKVNLHNHGETPLDLQLRGMGEGLRFKFKPASLTLPVGHSVRIRGRVRATRLAIFRERRKPFLISAQGPGTPTTESGSFTQFTVIPPRFVRLVMMTLVMALFAGGVYVAKSKYDTSTQATAAKAVAATSTTVSATTIAEGADAEPAPAGDAAPAAADPASADPPAAPAAAPKVEKAVPAGDAIATPAAAVISGTVSGPKVLAGIPIVLQRVSLGDVPTKGTGKIPAQAPSNPLAGEVLSEQRSVTDVGGRFRFAGDLAVPAIYRISAAVGGFEKGNVIASLTMDVPAAELAIGLVPAKGRLAGKVVDANGVAVGDATVTVVDGDISYTARTASQGDAAGQWSIEGMHTPASYLVSAQASGFATGSTVLELGGGQARSDANLALVRGLGTMHGTVSSRGVGVGAITLEVRAIESDTVRSTTTLTDGSTLGTFSLPNLPLGRYSMTLSGEGWLTQTRQVELNTGDLQVDISDLRRSTATVQGRVFQVADPGCVYPAPAAILTGTSTPQPCGNVGVIVQNDQGSWRTTSASGTGEFSVSGVPAGTFTVRLERYGYSPATMTVSVGAGDIATVGPVGTAGVDPIVLELSLNGGGTNSAFRAVLRDDHDPTTALDLACLHPTLTVTESTGITSAVLLSGDGDPTACSNPLPTFAAAAAPVAGARPMFSLCPTDGSAIPGSGVRACIVSGGGIRVEGLAPGAKTVKISADGFDEVQQVAQVPANGVAELGTIRLLPLGTLSGQVSGGGDSPIAGARIFVAPFAGGRPIPAPPSTTDGGWYACSVVINKAVVPTNGLCVETNSAGEYKFGRALRSSDYQIFAPVGDVIAASSPGSPSAETLDHDQVRRESAVDAGESTTLDLRLRRFGAIAGVIQTPDETGVNFRLLDGVTVTSATTGDVTDTTRITVGTGATGGLASGRYRVDRLLSVNPLAAPPEGYRFTFHKDGFRDSILEIPGGVAFNQEKLQNVILTPEPVPALGTVVWRPDPATPSFEVPIPGASVRVSGITSYILVDAPPYVVPVKGNYDAVTTVDGNFSDPADTDMVFAAGRVTVAATAADGFTLSTAEVPFADATHAEVVLEPIPHNVTGSTTLNPTVTPNDGITAASIWSGLTASLRPPSGGTALTVGVTDTGTFVLPAVRPDTRPYTLAISGPGISTLTVPVTVAPADPITTVAVQTLTRRGHLTVKVVDNAASPAGVGRVNVEVRKAGNLVLSGVTCIDPTAPGGVPGCPLGTVVFNDLDLDTYELRAGLTGWVPVTLAATDLSTQARRSVTMPNLVQYGRVSGTVKGKNSPSSVQTVPLANAKITATPVGGGTSAVGFSGPDGTFTLIGDLIAGQWNIVVSAGGYGELNHGTVTLANETVTHIGDVLLTAAPSTLSGKVTLADGATNVVVTVTVQGSGQVVTAAADGTYGFPPLPPQTYTVIFSADDNRNTVTRVVNLRAGESEIENVTMSGPVGKIFGIVEGKNSAAGPSSGLANATVRVLKANGNVVRTVATLGGGAFTIDDVPSGNYNIEVSAAGYATEVRAATVTAGASASTYIAATLIAVPSSIIADVTSSANGALGSVEIVAVNNGTTVSALSGVDGRVTLSGLTPGTWTMSAKRAATAIRDGEVDPHADKTLASLVVPVGTAALPSPSYTLDRHEGIVLTLIGRDTGTGTGTPLTGATVTATRNSGTPLSFPADAAGVYILRAPMSSGNWTVSVTAPGYGADTESVSISSDDVETASLLLTASTRSLVVAVASSSGPALGGVKVLATRDGATTGVEVTTNPSGNATFPTLTPGTYTFAATNATGLVDPHANTSVDSIVVPRSPAAVPATTVTLDRHEGITVPLTGRDHPTATPAALTGATVTATPPGGGTAVTLDEVGSTGTYTTRGVMVAGDWAIAASKAGYTTLSTTASVTADTIATVAGAVMVAAARSTVITVASSAGGNLSNVGVTATLVGSPSTTFSGTTTTGSVTLALPPGAWTLATSGAAAATSAGNPAPHEDNTKAYTVGSGGGASLATTITLQAATTPVTGQVVSSFVGGQQVNLVGATVTYTRTPTSIIATTVADGRFSTKLTPGKTWVSTIEAVGHTTLVGSLVTPATGSANAGKLVLKRLPLAISGRITLENSGADPAGVAGVKVEVRAQGSSTLVQSDTSGPDGDYVLSELDPNVTWEVKFDALTATDATLRRQPVTRLVSALAGGGTTVTLDHVVPEFAGSVTVNVTAALVGQAGVATVLSGTPQVEITDTAAVPSIDPIKVPATGGTAIITDMPNRSTFKVRVTLANYVSASGDPFVEQSAITVTKGTDTAVNIKLYPVARTLNVTLKDAGGTLVPNASLTLSGGGLSGGGQTVSTSAAGVASFTGVPAAPSTGGGATYSLGLSGSGFAASTRTGIAVPLGAAATTVTRTEDMEQFDVTVKGNPPTGSDVDITDATVTATKSGETAIPVPYVSGAMYRLKGFLAGSYLIDADGSTSGYAPGSVSKTASAGAVVSATLTLDPAPRNVTVTVRSTDATTGVLNGISITATKTGATPVVGTTVGAGQVVLPLAPGTWTFATTNATSLADPHSDVTGVGSLVVPVTGTFTAPTISLDRYEGVSLRLTGKDNAADGTPSVLTGATVTMTQGLTSHTLTETAVGSGVYAYRGVLSAAVWTLAISAPNYDAPTTAPTAVIVVDKVTDINQTLFASPHPVVVTVLGSAAGNPPVVGTTVTATLAGETTVAGPTLASGQVTLQLRPGTWHLVVPGGTPHDITVPAATTYTFTLT